MLPALFTVTGVEAGDVLNVRAEPSASAPIVGALARDSGGIEIVRLDEAGRWGQVNTGEGQGWVSMRFMQAEPPAGEEGLPDAFSCYGTEPFWGLRHVGDVLEFSTPEEIDPVAFTPETVLQSMALPQPHWILLADADHGGAAGEDGRRLTAIVEPKLCSDGMSDRQFGLAVTLVDDRPQTPRAFSGCCTLQPAR